MKKEIYYCDLCEKELKPEDYFYYDMDNHVNRLFGHITMRWADSINKKEIDKHIECVCSSCIGIIWNRIMSLKVCEKKEPPLGHPDNKITKTEKVLKEEDF